MTLADRRTPIKTDCGLHISVTPDGTLKRDLAAIHGEVSLADTTAEDEIIIFSELDFGPYAAVIDLITISSALIPHEGRVEEADMSVFRFIQNTTFCWCISLPANRTWRCANAVGGISSPRRNERRCTVTGNLRMARPSKNSRRL